MTTGNRIGLCTLALVGFIAGRAAADDADCGQTCTVELTRYIAVQNNWSEPDDRIATDYSDLYTSIIVTAQALKGRTSSRRYEDEERNLIERFLASDATTNSVNLHASVLNPTFNTTIPLLTLSHTSSSDQGEVFVTDLVQSNYHTPLFRISSTTVIGLRLETKISRQIQSQAVSTSIKAITGAITIAAPSSALLTTLSKVETEKTAHAVDATISALLADAKTESIGFDRHMSAWIENTSSLIVSASVPLVHRATDADVKKRVIAKVGEWKIEMSCPRPSVFYSATICDTSIAGSSLDARVARLRTEASQHVVDTQILQFRLSNQVSLSDFVQTQPWYTSFVRDASRDKDAEFFNHFCSDATDALTANGLNQFDAGLALRAISHVMSVINKYGDQIAQSCLAKAPYVLYGLY